VSVGASAARAPKLGVQRELFDIPETVTYLNCANMAPQLRIVTASGVAAVRHAAAPWTRRPDDWFAPAERLRALFARIINADADGIAIVPSVSYGIAIAARNLEIDSGQSIVLLDGEFPSNVYAWRELARRRNAVIRMVTRGSSGSWTEAVIEAIGPDTAVVSVPNCHWTDGRLVDLTRVAPAARAIGAALVVDASQSAGAYPLDVSLIQPDFLVTVGYKWLLGPYGLGYLYVAPRWRSRGVPIEHSWLTRAGAEDFTRLNEYVDGYRPGARRFDMGEFPQFVLTEMAAAALEQVIAWGVDRIQQTVSELTWLAEQGAIEAGAAAVHKRDRVGHLIGIRPYAGVRTPLLATLAAANVHVSIRGDSIRVAPHVYNTGADIARLMVVLREDASAARQSSAEEGARDGTI
jgi:selenocysteine lyase/cysteine desulfurase